MKEELVERLVHYCKFDTRSDESSHTIPTTQSQVDFAKRLAGELEEMGLSEVHYNESNGFVTATLPATSDKAIPTIGFIAHVDTADFESRNIKPRVHPNYDGGKIPLDESANLYLDPDDFPNLLNYVGHTMVTASGHTLLGVDDKAGIAEIVTAMHYFLEHPEIPHGKVRVAFGPDEEIGRGADNFDVKGFACDFAYTLDGGPVGELQDETFHAAKAIVHFQGKNVHTGTAKGHLINAIELARQFLDMLPEADVPERTDDRKGFYHPTNLNGSVEEMVLDVIIRDFDRTLFNYRKSFIEDCVEQMNERYPGRVSLDLFDQYYNMKEIIDTVPEVMNLAEEAMKSVGVTVLKRPIRGGTDGCKISYMGLPTPNIFVGGENFHGRFEFTSAESMEKAAQVVIAIIEKAAQA